MLDSQPQEFDGAVQFVVGKPRKACLCWSQSLKEEDINPSALMCIMFSRVKEEVLLFRVLWV